MVRINVYLVTQQNWTILEHCTSNCNTLLLSTGQLQSTLSYNRLLFVWHLSNNVAESRLRSYVVHALFWSCKVAVAQIVVDRVVEQNCVLRDHRNVAAQ